MGFLGDSHLFHHGLTPEDTPKLTQHPLSSLPVVLLDFAAAKGELGWLTHPYGKGVSLQGAGVGMRKLRPREDGAWPRSNSSARVQTQVPSSHTNWAGWGWKVGKGPERWKELGRQLKALAEQDPWMPQKADGQKGPPLAPFIPLLGGKGLKAPPAFEVPAQEVRGEEETGNVGSQVPTAPGNRIRFLPAGPSPRSSSCCFPFLLGVEFVLPPSHPSSLPPLPLPCPAVTWTGGPDPRVLSLALSVTTVWPWGGYCCSLGLSFPLVEFVLGP